LTVFWKLDIICNLTVNFVGFHKFLAEYTVHNLISDHPGRACLPHWCCQTVLPDGSLAQSTEELGRW